MIGCVLPPLDHIDLADPAVRDAAWRVLAGFDLVGDVPRIRAPSGGYLLVARSLLAEAAGEGQLGDAERALLRRVDAHWLARPAAFNAFFTLEHLAACGVPPGHWWWGPVVAGRPGRRG